MNVDSVSSLKAMNNSQRAERPNQKAINRTAMLELNLGSPGRPISLSNETSSVGHRVDATVRHDNTIDQILSNIEKSSLGMKASVCSPP